MPMSEFDLIQISSRFRKLEDAVESADILHAERIERAQERIDKNDAAHAAGKVTYQVFCVRGNLAAKERDDTKELREALEKALEACREDMVAMQESITGTRSDRAGGGSVVYARRPPATARRSPRQPPEKVRNTKRRRSWTASSSGPH